MCDTVQHRSGMQGALDCKNQHGTKCWKSFDTESGAFVSNPCKCCKIKQMSASSGTEYTRSHYNLPPLLSPPSTTRPVPCDGAKARAPAVPATPSTWTRSAAHPAARPRNCLGLRRETDVIFKIKKLKKEGRINKQMLTAVDGQVDVAVLCSKDVRSRAAIQAGCLRCHIDYLDQA